MEGERKSLRVSERRKKRKGEEKESRKSEKEGVLVVTGGNRHGRRQSELQVE